MAAKTKKNAETLDATASRIEALLEETADPDKELAKQALDQADALTDTDELDEDADDEDDEGWDDDELEDDEDEDEEPLVKAVATPKGKAAAKPSAISASKRKGAAIPDDDDEDDEDDFDDDDEDDGDNPLPSARKAKGKPSAIGKYTGPARAKTSDTNEDGTDDNSTIKYPGANKRMGKSIQPTDAGDAFLLELAADVETASVLDDSPVLQAFAAQIGEMTAMLEKQESRAIRMAKSVGTIGEMKPYTDPKLEGRINRLEKAMQTNLRLSERLLEMGLDAEAQPAHREIVTVPPTYGISSEASDPRLRKGIREDQTEAGKLHELHQMQARFSEVQRHDPDFGSHWLWKVQAAEDVATLRKSLPEGKNKSFIVGDIASLED